MNGDWPVRTVSASLQEEQCLPRVPAASLLSLWPYADWQWAILFLFWPTICSTPPFECGSPGTYGVKFSFCHCFSCAVNLLVGRGCVASSFPARGTILARVGRKDRNRQAVCEKRRDGPESWTYRLLEPEVTPPGNSAFPCCRWLPGAKSACDILEQSPELSTHHCFHNLYSSHWGC